MPSLDFSHQPAHLVFSHFFQWNHHASEHKSPKQESFSVFSLLSHIKLFLDPIDYTSLTILPSLYSPLANNLPRFSLFIIWITAPGFTLQPAELSFSNSLSKTFFFFFFPFFQFLQLASSQSASLPLKMLFSSVVASFPFFFT